MNENLDWVEVVYSEACRESTGDSTVAFNTYGLKAVAAHALRQDRERCQVMFEGKTLSEVCEIATQQAQDAELRGKLVAALILARMRLANCIPTAEITGPKPLPVIEKAIALATERSGK